MSRQIDANIPSEVVNSAEVFEVQFEGLPESESDAFQMDLIKLKIKVSENFRFKSESITKREGERKFDSNSVRHFTPSPKTRSEASMPI